MSKLTLFFLLAAAVAAQKTVTVIGVGDYMMGTHYPNASYLSPFSEKSMISDLQDILTSADVTFANFEGVFLDEGRPTKNCKDSTKCYVFKTPPKYANQLALNGFDAVSVANNHSRDFGNTGKAETRRVLDSLGIHYSGWLEKPYVTWTQDSIIYSLISFAPNEGTLDINNRKQATKLVNKLSETSDIVIVSFHGGAEGSKYQNVPKEMEIFYGERRGDVYQFAHDVIDAGADVVFGHGPHVTRAMEIYKGRYIAYSLGNFWTYGRFNIRGANGIAPIVKLKLKENGEFVSGEIIPIKQIGRGIPVRDKSGAVIKKINSLNKKDLPENVLTISASGKF